MKNRIDEKKLTDYVLGEVSQEEKQEIEQLLEESAELRKEVEEIQQVAFLLSEGLANEPESTLTAGQRGAIHEETHKSKRTMMPLYRLAGGLAAACLMFAVYVNWPDNVLEKPEVPAVQIQPVPLPVPPNDSEELATSPSPIQPAIQEQSKIPAVHKPTQGGKPPAALKAPRRKKPIQDTQAAEKKSVPGGDHQEVRVLAEIDDVSSMATTIDEKQIQQLRPNGRNYLSLAEHSPGILKGEQGGRGQAQNGASKSGGLAMEHVAISLDGADNTGRVVYGPLASQAQTAAPPPEAVSDFNTETYDRITENSFIRVSEHPLSTFSIDVDTASYANVRRFLNQRQSPPRDAVRIEELINYFDYGYAPPEDNHPFAAHIETATAPWNKQHLLVRFGLKGEEIELEQRKPGNFVFLIDVSGSMRPANKLPLLKRALRLMVDSLNEGDRVAVVVYAGASGLVLPSTACTHKETILQALDRLDAGGSTNGGAGIELAYKVAEEHRISNGINRVIIATDGDFNIGVTNQGDLTRLIEEKAETGVFLTVLGFGMGNYKDSTLEKLADRGNGNYAYIDTLQEARKVLVEEIGGTLVTIAKDVKIQVEFNPVELQAYRLIGYENRLLQNQDFNDDTKDAGEIGAGHTVTVFYEIVPHGVELDLSPPVDPLKYQARQIGDTTGDRGELLTLKLRYKEPDETKSKLMEIPLRTPRSSFETASADFRFAAAVASFGMLLRDSSYKGNMTFDRVIEAAQASLGSDPHGYRNEFVSLVKKARAIGDLENLER